MRTDDQGLGARNTEKGASHIDQYSNSSERRDAGQNGLAGISPSLPQPKRWVPHRKAEVVAAVRGGFLSLDEARRRYALSMEEYLTWQSEIDRYGLAGLRVYKTQQRRRVEPRSTDQ